MFGTKVEGSKSDSDVNSYILFDMNRPSYIILCTCVSGKTKQRRERINSFKRYSSNTYRLSHTLKFQIRFMGGSPGELSEELVT